MASEPLSAFAALGEREETVEITALVPVYNEAENLAPLLTKLTADLRALGRSYEILIIDDGSTDGTLEALRGLRAAVAHLRLISFRRNHGKSAALSVGFRESRGRFIVTMDGDLQDDSAEIGPLLRKMDEGYDLVSGWKQKRKDPITKTVPSKLFNAVTSVMTGVRLHDMNCGLKAYRAEVARSILLRGELHRFIPVLAHWNGYRVGEIRTAHHPRLHGRTKFGASRFVNGFLDLLTVMFLTTSAHRPLHLFGRVGILFAVLGAGILVWFTWPWLQGHGLRLRPALLFGAVLMILGLQFLSMGFLGELIAGLQDRGADYSIRERF
ncbi:MAG TPA: glycosyltransferase family 2 protein [Candidatus Eisenbacteria bacterium]|jgi:glycosyltransferase involved in cell wall biosynthesis